MHSSRRAVASRPVWRRDPVGAVAAQLEAVDHDAALLAWRFAVLCRPPLLVHRPPPDRVRDAIDAREGPPRPGPLLHSCRDLRPERRARRSGQLLRAAAGGTGAGTGTGTARAASSPGRRGRPVRGGGPPGRGGVSRPGARGRALVACGQQGGHLRRVDGLGEVEPLPVAAVDAAEELQLPVVLDALGDHRQAERVAELDDARASAAHSRFVSTPSTKERSIFSASIGNWRR